MSKNHLLAFGVTDRGKLNAQRLFGRMRSDEGFNGRLVLDPKASDIIKIIREYIENIQNTDNALFYYAGRSKLHTVPAILGSEGENVDPNEERTTDFVNIQDILNLIKNNTRAKVMVVFDYEDRTCPEEVDYNIEEICFRQLRLDLQNVKGENGLIEFLFNGDKSTSTSIFERMTEKVESGLVNSDHQKQEKKFRELHRIGGFNSSFSKPLSDPEVGGGRFNGVWFGTAVDFDDKVVRDRPYPALQSFGLGESDYFFGREKELLRMTELVQNAQGGCVSLNSETGMGKSSFLKVFLSKWLQENKDYLGIFINDYSEDPWTSISQAFGQWIDLKGIDDFGALFSKLKQRIPQRNIILILDQLERVFHLDADKVKKFLTSISNAVSGVNVSGNCIKVIYSIRSSAVDKENLKSLPIIFKVPAVLKLNPLVNDALIAAIEKPLNGSYTGRRMTMESNFKNYFNSQVTNYCNEYEGQDTFLPVHLQLVCNELYQFAVSRNLNEFNEDLCQKYLIDLKKRNLFIKNSPNLIEAVLAVYVDKVIDSVACGDKDSKLLIAEILCKMVDPESQKSSKNKGESFSGTAYAVDISIDELSRTLAVPNEWLVKVLGKLEADHRFVFVFNRGRDKRVRLTHDFLAQSLARKQVSFPDSASKEIDGELSERLIKWEADLKEKSEKLESERGKLESERNEWTGTLNDFFSKENDKELLREVFAYLASKDDGIDQIDKKLEVLDPRFLRIIDLYPELLDLKGTLKSLKLANGSFETTIEDLRRVLSCLNLKEGNLYRLTEIVDFDNIARAWPEIPKIKVELESLDRKTRDNEARNNLLKEALGYLTLKNQGLDKLVRRTYSSEDFKAVVRAWPQITEIKVEFDSFVGIKNQLEDDKTSLQRKNQILASKTLSARLKKFFSSFSSVVLLIGGLLWGANFVHTAVQVRSLRSKNAKAEVLMADEDYKGALVRLNEALDTWLEHDLEEELRLILKNNKAIVLSELGNHKDALGILKELIREKHYSADEVVLNNNLGLISEKVEDYQSAIKYYEAALKKDPDNFMINLNLGYLYENLSNPLAKQYLKKAESLDPVKYGFWKSGDRFSRYLKMQEAYVDPSIGKP